jgi:sugar lactone lactonase YvrE
MPMQEPHIRMLVDARNRLGESPIWDEREKVLWWVDNLQSVDLALRSRHRRGKALADEGPLHAPRGVA